MFVHKVAGNWGGKQEWSDDTDPFTVFELYEQGNRYLYQYFCPFLGADTDIFHISQNLPFVHSRLRWVLGQLIVLFLILATAGAFVGPGCIFIT